VDQDEESFIVPAGSRCPLRVTYELPPLRGRGVFVSFNVIQKAKLLRIRSLDDFQFKGIT